ncbi:hypothetical protein [Opitutus terrae]|uniref:Uncharacterized protein n=1 Tax=Opitutus terrae (strain DSM 11246 / JCM 15787 / PB90-1) TaxID=452637 RepID=B1ZT28_OPITP|nr:hypothetical protein [Opitutus terrae]ACB75817.1 hypothetical protein Oter_2535 [Opitutus terrae PB90-1]
MIALVDVGYSTGVEPIHRELAFNQPTKSEDQHVKTNKDVGLDVHLVDTQVAIAETSRTGNVRLYGAGANDLHAMARGQRPPGRPRQKSNHLPAHAQAYNPSAKNVRRASSHSL